MLYCFSSNFSRITFNIYKIGQLKYSLLCMLCGLLSKCLAFLMKNYFPKRPPGAPLHTSSKLFDVPVGFAAPLPPPSSSSFLFI